MTKILRTFLLTSLFFLNVNYVDAECSYTEKTNLNKLAANVKADYEIKREKVQSNVSDSGETVTEEIRSINMNVYNLSPEIYVMQTDNQSGEIKRLNYGDALGGKFTTNFEDISIIRKYTFTVYSSDSTECPNEELKTIYVTIPKFNDYYDMCEGAEEFNLCKEFITVDINDSDEFERKLNIYLDKKYKNIDVEDEKDDKWYDNVIDFFNDYKIFFIITIVLVIGVAGFFVIKKKKRQRELGL